MPTLLGLTNDSPSKTQSQVSQPSKMGSDTYISKNKPLANPERLNTISKRNHAAALEIETLLWRSLCDKPEKAKEYMADDCIILAPVLFTSSSDPNAPVSKDTEPSIHDVLEEMSERDHWVGFRFRGEPLVVEVDLMAVSLVYGVSLFRRVRSRKGGEDKIREVKATGSSSWRQTAGGDWLCCSLHVAYADEEEEEYEDDDGEEEDE